MVLTRLAPKTSSVSPRNFSSICASLLGTDKSSLPPPDRPTSRSPALVTTEARGLPGPNHAHVGFIDARPRLHLRQVFRNDEKRRRVHAGRNGLTHIDVAQDDDAGDRRGDDGVVQVDLGLIERRDRLIVGRLGGLELRLGHTNIDLRGLEILRRHEILRG